MDNNTTNPTSPTNALIKEHILRITIRDPIKFIETMKYIAQFTEYCDLVFLPDTDNDRCMKILYLTCTKNVLVKMSVSLTDFEYYKCQEKINFGIDTRQFSNRLMMLKDCNEITLFITNDDPDVMHVRGETGGKIITIKIGKLLLQPLDMSIVRTTFPYEITIGTSEYGSTVNDVSFTEKNDDVPLTGKIPIGSLGKMYVFNTGIVPVQTRID